MSTNAITPSQDWGDADYCAEYATTWEISTDEVHYGWMADGESKLRLLEGLPDNAVVLDVGCGMGENLIALAKRGLLCYGIDISPHMLAYAKKNIAKKSVRRNISLAQEDMCRLNAFSGIKFDLILSVYSMEYLRNVGQFKAVVNRIVSRLAVGGLFVMCVSHPTQHINHRLLMNKSDHAGDHKSPLIYSIRDVVKGLSESGLCVERIVEQSTRNPSMITYEQAAKFPYHFRAGQSPFQLGLDEVSNSGPHSIIYVSELTRAPSGGLQAPRDALERLFIWGEGRRLTERVVIKSAGRNFAAFSFLKRDATAAACPVMQFTVRHEDLHSDEDYKLDIAGKGDLVVSSRSLLGVLHRKMCECGWEPHCRVMRVEVGPYEWEPKAYIAQLEPIGSDLSNRFPDKEIGIVVFLNGKEPGGGTVGLDDVFPNDGDTVDVVYLISRKQKQVSNQRRLFDQDDPAFW